MSRRRQDSYAPPKAWRKAGNKDAERRTELERRVLGDLEDCRRAWEKANDPVALLVGVQMAEALDIPLPQWLFDAVLVVMASAFNIADLGRLRLPDLWAARVKQAEDAHRAEMTLLMRTLPEGPATLEDAYSKGADLAADHAGARHVGATEAKASYLRVIRNLRDNEALYHGAPPGVLVRVHLALSTLPAAVAAPLRPPEP
jgi:hypothetical protein